MKGIFPFSFWALILLMLVLLAYASYLALDGPLAARAEDPLYIIRNCESGGDYTTDTGNGYYGAYQFSLETWQFVGGVGLPNLAPPEEQDARALYLLTHYGPGHWPVCGRLI